MKKKNYLKYLGGIVSLLAFASTHALAQNVGRTVQTIQQQPDSLRVVTNDGEYQFRAYTAQMIETSFIPRGQQMPVPASHAVVLQPEKIPALLKKTADGLDYQAGDMTVHIQESPFQISYSYKNRLLFSEKQGYSKIATGERLDFNLTSDEVLYGAGARALGMNRRGYRLPLYNKAHYGYEEHSEQMNFSIPLVLSSRMYGIHFDNAAIGYLDLDSQKNNTLAYETIRGRKVYQVMAGDSWEQLSAGYANLTGHQPLPPRWAFGNFASRFGYHSEAEARAVIARFQAEQIPVDAIIFDLYWFGKEIKGTMGNLAFDPDNFPQPEKMIADFRQQGIKTILITEPFILTTSGRWKEAADEKILATDQQGKPFTYDFYFGHTGLIDLFDPHARDWFWNVYKTFKAKGVTGWWGDLGEPEVHPAALQHKNGSADDVHNIYGHEWAKLIAEGYARDFPQERPFILMRAGYSGSQRYGMIPWSGDVSRSWGGLRSQPEIALQMGMQGMAYMHSDLGGFAGPNLDDELYARWLQYGVFQPVFRPHAQEEVASEPVFREAKTKALAKAAIELRYRLLPYNYTLAFDNHETGLPLMRPLFFVEPGNPALSAVADSYLWGSEFLVHPVLQTGQQQAEIYFPGERTWFDFYSGEAHAAGSSARVKIVADHIPVFVRAGAFIPMAKPMQNTREYSGSEFDLHYYHDASVTHASGKLFDDDGETADSVAQQKYAVMYFQSEYASGTLRLQLSCITGKNYPSRDRKTAITIHHILSRPVRVFAGNTPLAFDWNASTGELKIMLTWKDQERPEISVKLSD